jgi:hypothetical protein
MALLFLMGAAPATAPSGQSLCRPETDPASPRKSRLAGRSQNDQIIQLDLDNDGDPDVLECWWHGKRCRWIDENDDMKSTDSRGDTTGDVLQVDRDGDGYYDGPDDMNIKWCDDDGDHRPDLQIVTINPTAAQRTVHGGASHYMVFVDIDHDGVNAYVDWDKFDFANWRTTGAGNFSPDYNGNAIFLKQHLPPWLLSDARFNWENPFAFYDFDGDGCTEMAIRLLDVARHPNPEVAGGSSYSGTDNEAFNTFDLDNDSQKGNEFDYDMTLRFFSNSENHGQTLDYSQFHDRHPKMKAPAWVLDAGLFRFDNWRRIEEFCYVTHERCFDELYKPKWGSCWLVFDEDDDDHRWERVELYYPTKDPYSVKRWRSGVKRDEAGLGGHPQADSLGDRGEWDNDNSGQGQLYIGRWDQKIHLYGAESGAWTVDYGGKYWGAGPVVTGGSSAENAPKVQEIVQYADTDNNGFFDHITFDYDGDRTVDLAIDLLSYKTADNPHPDVADLHNPAKLKWPGLHELYGQISARSFDDALKLYRALWKKNLTDKELDDLALASSTAEKYDHGYWLKEKIFRIADSRLSADTARRDQLRKAYFLGDIDAMVRCIDELPITNQ